MTPGSLVYVRYRDHMLFRNMGPGRVEPVVRETVGWVLREDERAIVLVWDRPVKPSEASAEEPGHAGLVLLRGEVLEVERLG